MSAEVAFCLAPLSFRSDPAKCEIAYVNNHRQKWRLGSRFGKTTLGMTCHAPRLGDEGVTQEVDVSTSKIPGLSGEDPSLWGFSNNIYVLDERGRLYIFLRL